jgi:hypothetical protein
MVSEESARREGERERGDEKDREKEKENEKVKGGLLVCTHIPSYPITSHHITAHLLLCSLLHHTSVSLLIYEFPFCIEYHGLPESMKETLHLRIQTNAFSEKQRLVGVSEIYMYHSIMTNSAV